MDLIENIENDSFLRQYITGKPVPIKLPSDTPDYVIQRLTSVADKLNFENESKIGIDVRYSVVRENKKPTKTKDE